MGVNGLSEFLPDVAAGMEAVFRHLGHIAEVAGPAHAAIGLDYLRDTAHFWDNGRATAAAWPAPPGDGPRVDTPSRSRSRSSGRRTRWCAAVGLRRTSAACSASIGRASPRRPGAVVTARDFQTPMAEVGGMAASAGVDGTGRPGIGASDAARALARDALVWGNTLPWGPGYADTDETLPRFHRAGVDLISLTAMGPEAGLDGTVRQIARVRARIAARRPPRAVRHRRPVGARPLVAPRRGAGALGKDSGAEQCLGCAPAPLQVKAAAPTGASG